MKKIAIFGAGGFGREVHMLINQINKLTEEWEFIGYFDDNKSYNGRIINGFKVLGGADVLNSYKEEIYIVFAIGDPRVKKSVVEKVVNKFVKYPTLVHPSVLLGDSQFIEIGEGTIICANVVVTVNVKIGKHVILNLACTVGHDTIIGDYCSFMPSINISGEVRIENCVYIGTGAKIINRLKIGDNAIVGAGAVVVKDLPSFCTAVGVPAKPIEFFG